MSEANKQVVLTFMKAMGTSDPDLARTVVDPGAKAVAKGYGKFAGTRDAETMVAMIGAFPSMIPTGLNFTIKSVTAEGDRVVVEAEGDAETTEGVPYRNQYCFVYTVRDGLIVHNNEYFCTVHADEVLWPLAVKLGMGAADA